MDASNNPVVRRNRKVIDTGDIGVAQKSDIDLSLDSSIVHGESMVLVADDVNKNQDYYDQLKFNEEPVTILVAENSYGSDMPETHVPVSVNGKGAEILVNGKWIEVTWLPVNQELTTKRKYVENLVRSKSDTIRTKHDDATVEKPRNTISRTTSAKYPISILCDENPKSREWYSRLMANH